MSHYPQFGPPTPSAPLEYVSRDPFECDFIHAPWSPASGQLLAGSGQYGTFVRSASLPGISDSNGVPYTAAKMQPGYEARDWSSGSDGVREAYGLRMSLLDVLAFPIDARLAPHAGLLEFIEEDSRVVGQTLFSWGVAGSMLFLDTSATGFYQVTMLNGGEAPRTSIVPSGLPVNGNRVTLTWELQPAGSLRVAQSINTGLFATGPASAGGAIPPQWGDGSVQPYVRFNCLPGLTAFGSAWYRRARIMYGPLNLTTLVERR